VLQEAAIEAASQQVRMAVARTQTSTSEESSKYVDLAGVKVFSATKAKERELLGDLITDWIRVNPNNEIIDKIVTQSSDSEFHCLTITVFYKIKA
jgi:hypothetical protein